MGIRAHSVHVYREDGTAAVHAPAPLRGGPQRQPGLQHQPGGLGEETWRVGQQRSTRRGGRGHPRSDGRAGKNGSAPRVGRSVQEHRIAFGFDVAIASLEEALRRGSLDGYSLQAVSARIAFDGLQAQQQSSCDLGAYDRALLASGRIDDEETPRQPCSRCAAKSPRCLGKLAFSQTAVQLCETGGSKRLRRSFSCGS